MRENLRTGGMGLVLLSDLLKVRTIIREKLLNIPLENGQEAINAGLKLQGQAKGIDLAIDIIFEIANHVDEPQENASS